MCARVKKRCGKFGERAREEEAMDHGNVDTKSIARTLETPLQRLYSIIQPNICVHCIQSVLRCATVRAIGLSPAQAHLLSAGEQEKSKM